MEQQNKAYLYAVSSVLLWSTAASAFKITLRYLDFLQLLLYSSFSSALVLFLIILLQKKIHLLKGLSFKEYAQSATLGFLNPFLYYIVLFKAYSLLPAQEAQPLNYTWPLMIVLLSIPLLKQKIRPLSILAVFISFIGVAVIGLRGDITGLELSNPLGVFLAVGSSVIWALFWIYNVRDERDEVVKLFLNFLFGFILIIPVCHIFSEVELPSWPGIFGSMYVGLFEMGITFVLWLNALKFSRTTAKVSNLIYLSPFLSLVFIRFIVGETIRISTIIGLVFIVSGIIVQRKIR